MGVFLGWLDTYRLRRKERRQLQDEIAARHNEAAVWQREDSDMEAAPPYFEDLADGEISVVCAEREARQVAQDWEEDAVLPQYTRRRETTAYPIAPSRMPGGWIDEEGTGVQRPPPAYAPPSYPQHFNPWAEV